MEHFKSTRLTLVVIDFQVSTLTKYSENSRPTVGPNIDRKVLNIPQQEILYIDNECSLFPRPQRHLTIPAEEIPLENLKLA